MNFLRFECGAVSPPFEGSFEEWVRQQIKDLGGYALGRRKDDGRLRVMVFDLNGGITRPRLPNGDGAPCLSCPCVGSSGRKELNGVPIDPRHGRRIVITCYPREVSGGEIDRLVEDATRKVAPATQDVASKCQTCHGDQYLQPCDACGTVRNDQECRSCFIHGDFEESTCPKCPVRNDRKGRA